MTYFILDSSALGKRYVREPGTVLVQEIFLLVQPERLFCLNIGALETLSVIVRARNAGRITPRSARDAIGLLHWEVLIGPVRVIPAPNDLIVGAAPLVEAHSINSTDAALLRAALDLRAAMRPYGDDLVLVSSDRRLLRAAAGEGLPVLDPEAEDVGTLQVLAAAP